jgi:flagellar basal-body rod modification protein FlgD
MSSYIDSINQATTASLGVSTAKDSKDAVMGKEDFLTLLVAQLQNQDPLNPDDPTEFTAQLAQFSSLEQLFSLNESMDNLSEANANSDRFSTLNTIGKNVAYHSDSLNFTGEPADIGYELDNQAEKVTISIQQNGVTVATLDGQDLSGGSHFITWDGRLANDQIATPGSYKIVVEATSATDKNVSAAPLIKSEVTGVDLVGQLGSVLLTRAGEVSFSSIQGVYE